MCVIYYCRPILCWSNRPKLIFICALYEGKCKWSCDPSCPEDFPLYIFIHSSIMCTGECFGSSAGTRRYRSTALTKSWAHQATATTSAQNTTSDQQSSSRNRLKPRIHDAAGCQSGCTTDLTTVCVVCTNSLPVGPTCCTTGRIV